MFKNPSHKTYQVKPTRYYSKLFQFEIKTFIEMYMYDLTQIEIDYIERRLWLRGTCESDNSPFCCFYSRIQMSEEDMKNLEETYCQKCKRNTKNRCFRIVKKDQNCMCFCTSMMLVLPGLSCLCLLCCALYNDVEITCRDCEKKGAKTIKPKKYKGQCIIDQV